MRKLRVFNSISVDGFFTDEHNDMSWAHKTDPQWQAFSAESAKGNGGDGMLLFGRVTYEMMASYWPTPAAAQAAPDIAASINKASKVVFSRTLTTASWHNTRIVKSDIAAEVRKLKETAGPDIVILGSGTIVSQLTEAGLIDTYELILNNLVLGRGRTLFEGVTKKVNLKLAKTQTFDNGNVVLWYQR